MPRLGLEQIPPSLSPMFYVFEKKVRRAATASSASRATVCAALSVAGSVADPVVGVARPRPDFWWKIAVRLASSPQRCIAKIRRQPRASSGGVSFGVAIEGYTATHKKTLKQ